MLRFKANPPHELCHTSNEGHLRDVPMDRCQRHDLQTTLGQYLAVRRLIGSFSTNKVCLWAEWSSMVRLAMQFAVVGLSLGLTSDHFMRIWGHCHEPWDMPQDIGHGRWDMGHGPWDMGHGGTDAGCRMQDVPYAMQCQRAWDMPQGMTPWAIRHAHGPYIMLRGHTAWPMRRPWPRVLAQQSPGLTHGPWCILSRHYLKTHRNRPACAVSYFASLGPGP